MRRVGHRLRARGATGPKITRRSSATSPAAPVTSPRLMPSPKSIGARLRKRLKARTTKQAVRAATIRKRVLSLFGSLKIRKEAACRRTWSRWASLSQQLLGVGGDTSTGNKVTILTCGSTAFRKMWDAIDQATDSIYLETYILRLDTTGGRTIQRLNAALERGVRVSLMYDSVGSTLGRGAIGASEPIEKLKQRGAHIIEFNPIFNPPWNRTHWFVHRNHRKLLLIDGQVAFCGGMNISDEYCGPDLGGTGKFHDTHVRVEGPAASHFALVARDSLLEAFGGPGAALPPAAASLLRWVTSTSSSPSLHSSSTPASSPARPAGQEPQLAREEQKENQPSPPAAPRPPPHLPSSSSSSSSSPPPSPAPSSKLLHQMLDRIAQTKRMWNAWKAASSSTDTDHHQLGPQPAASVSRSGAPTVAVAAAAAAPSSALGAVASVARGGGGGGGGLGGETHAEVCVQVLAANSWRNVRQVQRSLRLSVQNASTRCYITSPYFHPPPSLLFAMTTAAKRGVDVRVLTSGDRCDVPLARIASRYIYAKLIKSGVRIYEYQPATLHSKTVVVDSVYSFLGSFNFDRWSYHRNLEVGMAVLDPQVTKDMETRFMDNLRGSREIKADDIEDAPFIDRVKSTVAYVLATS